MSGSSQKSSSPVGPILALPALASIWTTLRSEVNPSDEQAPLALAKMRHGMASMQGAMRTMPILALLCGAIHLQWAPWQSVAVWLAVFFVALGFRRAGERRMPADGATPDEVRRGAWLFVTMSGMFIAAWAAQGFMFWVPGDPNNHLVIAILMLTSAMTSTLTAAWLINPMIQVAVYIGGVSVLMATEGTTQGFILAGLAAIYGNLVVGATVHINRNTSRMLTLETEKDALISNLRSADKAKSEFLANMSHELRTPLNAILGFSEVMKDEVMGPMQNAAYKSYAGDIHTSGTHLLGLVNDILDLAKIEAGKLDLRDDSFTMEAIVDEGFRLFELPAGKKNVRLIKNVDPAILLRWDLRAAKQIAINLLSNALKYAPEGGAITVSSGPRAHGGCYVTVADNGCGIAEKDRKLVFESFGQGRHDVATDVKSTGLGLAIVKALVELHGGEVWLASKTGEGAAFTIEVPPDRVTWVTGASAAA
ncbi:MAG: HAMP domain-containing sensor histidine kinase [Micropepsaceae bacterium]